MKDKEVKVNNKGGVEIMEKCRLWAFFEDGKWHIGMNKLDHRKNTEEAGYLVRDLWVQL